MPTLLPFGEGWMSGEAIDTSTRSIRAVYNRLRAFAEPLGFVPTKTGGDHRSLAEFLKNSKNPLRMRMGDVPRPVEIHSAGVAG